MSFLRTGVRIGTTSNTSPISSSFVAVVVIVVVRPPRRRCGNGHRNDNGDSQKDDCSFPLSTIVFFPFLQLTYS